MKNRSTLAQNNTTLFEESTSKSDAEPQEDSSNFVLKLSARDFVRTCQLNPNTDERVINVPLASLKTMTLSRLADQRNEIRPKKPAAAELPPPPPKITRKRPNPDRMTHMR